MRRQQLLLVYFYDKHCRWLTIVPHARTTLLCLLYILQGRSVSDPLCGHLNYVMSVDFSPRGNLLASASFDESVRLWDSRTGRSVRAVPAHSEPVTSARFNGDGTVIVTGSYDGLMWVAVDRGKRGGGATLGDCLSGHLSALVTILRFRSYRPGRLQSTMGRCLWAVPQDDSRRERAPNVRFIAPLR